MNINTNKDIMNNWLNSGKSVRICGQDLRPVPNGLFTDRIFCIVKGQAEVYFLKQVPHENIWLLKIFAPGRRPTDEYLEAVSNYLPGTVEFFTCTQRRFLCAEHLDLRNSGFNNPALTQLTVGSVIMPKVPGTTWASMADDLRDGTLKLSLVQRLRMSLSLAKCISVLEARQCSHRDLSSTNVFYENERAYLIDWDSLYHPQLPFQSNTTVGTMGYIPPFLNVANGQADVSLSWCLYADRFALALLITEFLLVDHRYSMQHEDGSLFSQKQIDSPDDGFVNETINQLKQISPPCAILLKQAFNSLSFINCPSPDDWISALKYTLRRQSDTKISGPNNGQQTRFVRVTCSNCNTSFKVPKSKVKMIEDKGQEILCRTCLKVQLNKWSAEKAQRDMDIPQVSCEHCHSPFRLQREKLDSLLDRGRPILCHKCLQKQMRTWKTENEKNYSGEICAKCGCEFNISKDKLDILKNKDKQILCRDCLKEKLQPDDRPKTPVIKKKTSFASSLWKIFGRTINDYYC